MISVDQWFDPISRQECTIRDSSESGGDGAEVRCRGGRLKLLLDGLGTTDLSASTGRDRLTFLTEKSGSPFDAIDAEEKVEECTDEGNKPDQGKPDQGRAGVALP